MISKINPWPGAAIQTLAGQAHEAVSRQRLDASRRYVANHFFPDHAPLLQRSVARGALTGAIAFGRLATPATMSVDAILGTGRVFDQINSVGDAYDHAVNHPCAPGLVLLAACGAGALVGGLLGSAAGVAWNTGVSGEGNMSDRMAQGCAAGARLGACAAGLLVILPLEGARLTTAGIKVGIAAAGAVLGAVYGLMLWSRETGESNKINWHELSEVVSKHTRGRLYWGGQNLEDWETYRKRLPIRLGRKLKQDELDSIELGMRQMEENRDRELTTRGFARSPVDSETSSAADSDGEPDGSCSDNIEAGRELSQSALPGR